MYALLGVGTLGLRRSQLNNSIPSPLLPRPSLRLPCPNQKQHPLSNSSLASSTFPMSPNPDAATNFGLSVLPFPSHRFHPADRYFGSQLQFLSWELQLFLPGFNCTASDLPTQAETRKKLSTRIYQ